MNIKSALQSTRGKFVALIMSILIVAIAILTILSSIMTGNIAYHSTENLLQPLQQQVSANIMSILKQNSKHSTEVAENEYTQLGYKVHTKQILMNIVENYDGINYAYLDKDGSVIVSYDGYLDSYAGSDMMKKCLGGAEVYSDPYDYNGTCVYDVLTPVYNNGQVKYIIIVTYNWAPIDEIVNNFAFGNSGYIVMINNEETLVAGRGDRLTNYKEAAQKVSKLKPLDKFYSNMISENEYGCTTFKSPENEMMIGCYAPVEGTQWYISLGAQKSEFASASVGSVLMTIGAGLIIMIVAFVLTLRMVESVMRPIVSSSQRLKALSNGDLNSPVSTVFGSDEIAVLARSLEETVSAFKLYIQKISQGLKAISDGNLTYKMDGDFRGDFVTIKTTFNQILESLRDTFANIDHASKQVNQGAVQVSCGAQTLSQGATEQSSAISQLASQLEDVSMQISSNVNAANNTSSIVEKNIDNIDICNNEMNKMLTSMDEIKKSSNEISKIIKVIDDIAFQTNILALNAAVEAARAGNAGKGFAVVADEVRNLAAKSAEAASQTTSLIEKSIAAVKNGSAIAKKTAGALTEIVSSSNQIASEVDNIADASHSQQESITQINTGVEQISSVTQGNTATAEESAAASEELSGQSEILANLIAKFKYDGVEEKSDDDFSDYDFLQPTNNNTSNSGNSNSKDLFTPVDNTKKDVTTKPVKNSLEPQNSSFEPVDNSFEPHNNSFEPVDNSFEPQDNSFEPVDNSFEPQDNSFEPVDNSFEPQDNSFEPVDNSFEPQDNSFEPVDNSFEPQDNLFEPSDNGFEPVEFEPEQINKDTDFDNVDSKY